jgi:uncharacterized protein (TIGR02466 family)
MNVLNLFPTPIGFFRLGRELTKKELSFVLGQDMYSNQGNTTSVDRKILVTPELADIKSFVEDAMQEYFDTVYATDKKTSLYLTQSWANYTGKNQYHHKHAHPNSIVSGVFYPQADRTVDRIYFFKDGYERIKLAPSEWNVWNSESWWYEVGSGDLILFPSNLMHMVQTKNDDNTRVSIAFNTFVKGNLGIDEELTSLQLGEV